MSEFQESTENGQNPQNFEIRQNTLKYCSMGFKNSGFGTQKIDFPYEF